MSAAGAVGVVAVLRLFLTMALVVALVGCGEQTGGSEVPDVSSPEIPEIGGEGWVLPELELGEDWLLPEVEPGGVDDGGVGGDDAAGGGVGGVDAVDGGDVAVLGEGLCGWPGPLCVGDEGVAALDEGGRLWWVRRSKWEPWVGQVLDMCNDHEALVSLEGENWTGYGKEIDYDAPIGSYIQRVTEERELSHIVCSEADAETPHWECVQSGMPALRAYFEGFEERPEPSEVMAWVEANGLHCWNASALGRRYVYMTATGPLWPQASVDEAVESFVERYGSGPRPRAWAGDELGYMGPRSSGSGVDDLVVLADTVTVTDGVVRGLAHNLSWKLWARDVVVSAIDSSGTEHVWRFGLVVQPGEVFPFEIEGWTGSEAGSEIAFEVSADLSPRIDLSRSLHLVESVWYDKEQFLLGFPEEIIDEAFDEIPDEDFVVTTVQIYLQQSTGHPRLAEAVFEQTVENLTVYAARLDDFGVVDVFELTPRVDPGQYPAAPDWAEVTSIPTDTPYGFIASEVAVAVTGYGDAIVWAGSNTLHNAEASQS